MYEHETFDNPAYVRATEAYETALAVAVDPVSFEHRDAAYVAAIRGMKASADGAGLAAAWYYVTKHRESGDPRAACASHIALLHVENAHFGPTDGEVTGTWHNLGAFVAEADGNDVVAVGECCLRLASAIRRQAEGLDRDDEGVQQLLMVLWSANAVDRMFHHVPALEGCEERELLVEAHRCLGHAYARAGRFAEARASYELALSRAAEDDEHFADLLLGRLEWNEESRATGLELEPVRLAALRRIVESPQLADHPHRMAVALAKLAHAEDLDRVTSIAIPRAGGFRPIAVELLRAGRSLDDVLAAFARAAERDGSPMALANVARFTLDHGLSESVGWCDRAIAAGVPGLLGSRLLLALDAGEDDAWFDARAAAAGSVRARALVEVIATTARAERNLDARAALDVAAAMDAWTATWRTHVDDDGARVG